ncbi:hypothetical protein RB195_017198 [Necator americanus]
MLKNRYEKDIQEKYAKAAASHCLTKRLWLTPHQRRQVASPPIRDLPHHDAQIEDLGSTECEMAKRTRRG